MKASKPQSIKAHNLVFLTKLVKMQGPISKGNLAKLSGLSVVTINKLIPELVAVGKLKEYSESVVTGGRHAVSYQYNPEHQLVLAIQLIEKAQKMVFNFYISDLAGKILHHEACTHGTVSLEELKEQIHQLISAEPRIGSISIGIPGVEAEGILKMLDYPPLLGVNLHKELTHEFHLPIIIENDINAAVLGYVHQQDKMGQSVVGVYYPKGFPPGSGIWLNGQLIRGRNGFAGEIKYLPLTAKWDRVPVAEIDCVENMAEVAQTIISMYDPHEIVIYTDEDQLSNKDLLYIEQNILAKFSGIKTPSCIPSTNFDEDYLQGLLVEGIELIEYIPN